MIYKQLLGQKFSQLHPKLQARYELLHKQPFHATGTMDVIQSGPSILKPFYYLMTKNHFLFPESGSKIPFTIQNTCLKNTENEYYVYWQRIFHFPNATRNFNATMFVDLENRLIQDYLGTPSLFYSDLLMDVTKDGELMIRSGKQSIELFQKDFRLPKALVGKVVVTEGYNDELQLFTIHVSIYNDLFGRMMQYAGHFTEDAH